MSRPEDKIAINKQFRVKMRYYCRDLTYTCNWHLRRLQLELEREKGYYSIFYFKSRLPEIAKFRSFVDESSYDTPASDFRDAFHPLRENFSRGIHFLSCYHFNFNLDHYHDQYLRFPLHHFYFSSSDRTLIMRACRAEALAPPGFGASIGECVDNYCAFVEYDPTCFLIYADWAEEHAERDSNYLSHLKRMGKRFASGHLNLRT